MFFIFPQWRRTAPNVFVKLKNFFEGGYAGEFEGRYGAKHEVLSSIARADCPGNCAPALSITSGQDKTHCRMTCTGQKFV